MAQTAHVHHVLRVEVVSVSGFTMTFGVGMGIMRGMFAVFITDVALAMTMSFMSMTLCDHNRAVTMFVMGMMFDNRGTTSGCQQRRVIIIIVTVCVMFVDVVFAV